MGDIVVGDIGDITNYNVTNVQNNKKNLMKEKEESHMWHCGWPMSSKCYPFYPLVFLRVFTWFSCTANVLKMGYDLYFLSVN